MANYPSILTQVLQSMLTQLPVLLVYIAGIILCAVWWERAPAAVMAAILGLAVMLVTTVGQSFLQNYVIQQRNSAGGSAASMGQSLMFIGFASSIARALGMALIVAGVFIGREKGARRSGFDVIPE